MDLSNLDSRFSVSVSDRETPQDAAHRRKKDFAIFRIGLIIITVIVIIAGLLAGEWIGTADAHKWGRSSLSIIFSGFLGYVLGKKA